MGSRYDRTTNDQKNTAYIPDFNKESKAASLKHLNENQYNSNSTNMDFNSNPSSHYINPSYMNFDSKLKANTIVDVNNNSMNGNNSHR